MNSVTTTHQYQLAGRGARLGAALLDIVIFAACLTPGIIAMSSSDSDMGKGVGIALLVIAWLGLMITQAVFLIKRGQSLGKIVVGIKIVRVSDESVPGFVKVFLLRLFVPNLLYGIPYLGVVLLLVDLLLIFREDRRCLHDLIAETKVVDATPVIGPAIVAPAPRPTFAASANPAYATYSPTPARSVDSSQHPVSMNKSTTSQEAAPPSTIQTALHATATAPIAFDEDAVYEVVANEMESGKTDKGLWTRLFAELDGDEKKTKIAYIKQRAEKIISLQNAQIEQIKREELAREQLMREEESRKDQEARRVQEHLRKLEADENQKQAVMRLAKLISEEPDAHIDTKIQLIKLLGGDFKWDEGIFTFACTAKLYDQEHKFKHNKQFEEWVVGQVIPQALVQG